MKFNINLGPLLGKLFPFFVPVSGQWQKAPRLSAGDKARRRSRYMPHQGAQEMARRKNRMGP